MSFSLAWSVFKKISRQVGWFESAHCNDESIAMHVGFILSAFFPVFSFDHIIVLSFCHSPGPQFCLKARRTVSEGLALIPHDTSARKLTFSKCATDVCVLRCH